MKHVDIFITHNMTGMKAGRAAYAYVISAGTSKGEATYTGFGVHQDATVNRINLAALKSALEHFHSPAEITVYTDSSTIAGAFNCGNLKAWENNGFQTAKKKPLANAELWRRIAELVRRHLVNVILTRRHQYTDWAERELERKYGKPQ